MASAGSQNRARTAWRALLLLSLVPIALALAPPLLARGGQPLVGALVHLAHGQLCHQMPERSFAIGGVALAVCSRCTGLWLGAPVGMALAPLGVSSMAARPWEELRPRALLAIACALLPMGLDWWGTAIGWWAPHNPVRAATGLLAAGMASWLVGSLLLRPPSSYPPPRTPRP